MNNLTFEIKNNRPECFGDLSREPYPCWVKQINVCIDCKHNKECRNGDNKT